MKNKYRIEGEIVYIELNHKGKTMETMIDLEDFDKANYYKGTWYTRYSKGTKSFYCNGNITLNNGKRTTIQLHRIIMNITDTKIQVDHIYHNTLDNRKSQMRLATSQEQQWNKRCRGYSWNKKLNKWKSRIRINGKEKHLGLFEKEEDVRQAYLDAKEKYYIIEEMNNLNE